MTRRGSLKRLKNDSPHPWRARWYEPDAAGKSCVRSKCFATKEEGVTHLALIVAAINRLEPTILDQARGKVGCFQDLVPVYLQQYKDRRVNSMTISTIKSSLEWIISDNGLTHVHQIDYEMLRKYAHRRCSLTADRGRKRISMIQTFLREMKLMGYRIHEDALVLTARKLGAKKPVQRRGSWSEAHLQAIFTELMSPLPDKSLCYYGKRTLNDWALNEPIYYRNRRSFAPVFLLLLRYPIRPITACSLNVGDWDPVHNILHVRPEITKNEEEVRLPIDSFMASLLNQSIIGKSLGDPLFSDPKSTLIDIRRWRRPHLSEVAMDILKRARVPGVETRIPGSLYRVKHTSCTTMSRTHRGDLPLVAMYTGHKDVKNLVKYLQQPEDRANVVSNEYERLNVADSNFTETFSKFIGNLNDISLNGESLAGPSGSYSTTTRVSELPTATGRQNDGVVPASPEPGQ